MNKINKLLLFALLVCFAVNLFGQQTILSKDYNSPSILSYNLGENHHFVQIPVGEGNAIAIPECSRFYAPNNSYFGFYVNENGQFTIDIDFRDSIIAGISIYKTDNANYEEIYCNEFDNNEINFSFKDPSLANQFVTVQLWISDPEYFGTAQISILENTSNLKVPEIDIDLYTPQQLVQEVLISGCVEALNVHYTGDNESIGYFDNGMPGLSFENGIVMSTGRVVEAAGPNNSGSVGTNLHNPGDPDLSDIVGGQTHDAAVLEFDFIPASDWVSFEYVFASEEYEEFVGQGFNDVFGFFISGGPEAYDKVNIARIPVSGDVVSINNVNQGLNSTYYINNDGGIHIQFDGMTVTLTAEIAVTPCETYTMKLAISDVGDGIYDSGVFLKANSFNSGASVVMRNYNAWGLINTMNEGCTNEIVFARSDLSNITEDMPVTITVTGNATNGTDYSHINNNYVIPAGQESISINCSALIDGVTEGPENLIITVYNGCPCSVQVVADTIVILDQIVFVPTLTNSGPICQGDSVLLSISYLPLPDTIRVEWSNGVIGPSSIWVRPNSTTTYSANIFYPCSVKNVQTTVIVNSVPIATASNGGPYCIGDEIELFSSGGVNYRWRGPNAYLNLQQNPRISNSQLVNSGTYQVTVTNSNGCRAIASTYVTINPLPIVDIASNSPYCEGSTISFTIGAFSDYYYTGPNAWSSSANNPTIPNAAEINEGYYSVIVSDINNCRAIDSTFVVINPNPIATVSSNSPICVGSNINLFANGGTTYNWTGPNLFSSNVQNPIINNATTLNSGIYTVVVSNAFNCTVSQTINYVVNPIPDASFTVTSPICINDANIILSPTNPGGTFSGIGIVNALTGEFSPSVAGAGTHLITYDLTQNACLGTSSESISVDALPIINISSVGPFCETEAAINLTTSTPGGIWSGNGITNNSLGTFNPSIAGPGNHTITYTLTNGTCVDSATIMIQIDSDVDATITPAGPFCETDIPVILTAVSNGGIWSGNGITNASTGAFSPNVASPGIHTITYNVVNGACSDSDSELITVYLYPDADFFTIGPFCESDAAVNIVPVISGGIFSGTGVTNAALGTFNPSTAGPGTHQITYTLVNGTCTAIITKPVEVYGIVDATITSAGPFCETAGPINLTAATIGGTWSGTGITNPITGTFNPIIANPGIHSITYSIVNGACSDTDTELITVSLYPNADFFDIGPFCESDAAVNIVPVTAGGVFSGTGITNGALGTFNPTIASPGTHQITYTLVNGACTAIITKPVVVSADVDATITPAGPFCQTQAQTNLIAADNGGTWSGTGITNPILGTFDPAVAGPGVHSVNYQIVNGACSDSHTESIVVNLFPNSDFFAVGPFCETAAAVNIVPVTIGGVFSGTGITNGALGTFNPGVAGAGTHQITYTIINGACTSVTIKPIVVNAGVDATINAAGPFCQTQGAVILTAVDAGGTWSGTGITNPATGSFNPAIAGVGIHTITYSITNGACSDSDTRNITVSLFPNSTINPAGPFCQSAAPINLSSVTLGGTWSGTGITNVVNGTFNPSVAGAGTHTITYTIVNGACTSISTRNIIVNASVNATITPVAAVCVFNPAFNLTAVSPGGTWSGTGITNTSLGTFDPTISGAGIHTVTYTVVNGACSATDTENINVIANPNPTIFAVGPFCESDAALNLTAVTAGGTWSGIGITNAVLGTFNPIVAGGGDFTITYNIAIGTCNNTATTIIHVDDEVDATITPAGPFCQFDAVQNLTAVSSGGIWAGTGITNTSTGTFNPTIAGIGTYNITYNIVNGQCSDADNISITVNIAPNGNITDPGIFCINDAPVNLNAATPGGTWAGTGITDAVNGVFDPSTALTGENIITYTISNVNCTTIGSISLYVYNAVVDATITSGGPYCVSQGLITLTANSSGGTWIGTGIVNATTGSFNPSVAGVGNHLITYNVGSLACFDTDSRMIQVEDTLSAIITQAGPICQTAGAFNLVAANPGGTWSGTGITNAVLGTFNPVIAGSGNHIITYTINQGSCTNTDNMTIVVNSSVNATITAAGPFCNNAPIQTLTAVSPGGTWSGTGIVNTTSGLFHPAVAGGGNHLITYNVTNGTCSATDTETIHVDVFPNTTIADAGPFCENASAVNLSAAQAGGTWSGTGITNAILGTFDPTIAGAGNHVISYSITNGACLSSSSKTIHVDDFFDATITAAGPFCNIGAVQNLTAASVGGIWSGIGITDANNGVFNPGIAGFGTFAIQYTTSNGVCNDVDIINIQVDQYFDATITPAGPFCQNNLSVILTAANSGGVWAGTGIVAPATGSFSPSVAGFGNHVITYTINNGACFSSDTETIHVDQLLNATISPAGPFCQNQSAQVLVAATTGGVWSGTGITNAALGTFNPGVAGIGNHIITYQLTNGQCVSSDTETLRVDAYPNTTLASVGPYCSNSTAIDLSEPSIGGTWSGTGITNPLTGIFNPSIAGGGLHLITYTIVNGACTSSGTTNILVNAAVDATISAVGPFCISDLSVVLSAVSSGGTWSGAGIVNPVTGLFNPSLAGGGNHTIHYAVSNGVCSDSDDIIITVETNPNATILTTGPFCETQANQVFSAATGGGVWSGNGIDMMGNFAPGVAGVGSHTITYSLAIGACVSTDTQLIQVDEYFDATITSSGPYCLADNAVNFVATNIGGTWSGNGINAAGLFTPATAGVGNSTISYTIVNGACSDSDSRIISVNNNPDATISNQNPLCLNSSPVNLTAATIGGTWSGNGITNQVLGSFDPNIAGIGTHTITYDVTVAGCNSTDNIQIVVNTIPDAQISNLNSSYCLNHNSVLVTATPIGGTLIGGNIIGNNFNPQTAGVGNHTITYTYTDSNNCTDVATLSVDVFALPNVSISNIDSYYCLFADTVQPVLIPAGGVLEGDGIVNYEFIPLLAGVGEQNFLYHFTDVNGCSDTAFASTIVLTVPEIEFTVINPTCNGLSNGSISAAVNGGLTPYDYLWSNSLGSTTNSISNLAAGTYYLTVTDDNSCEKIESVELIEPDVLTVEITASQDASCFGYDNGSATALAHGGTLDYNYLWNDLANTETSTVSNLIANTYTVIVTDANDCQASIDVTISEPEGVEINFVEVIPVVCYSQNNGSITIDPQGGSSPYTVHWNNPAGSNGYTIANLTAGYYTVTVTDLHNCQLVDSVEVIQPDSIYIQATINPVICAQQLGSVGITTFGGTAPYSFLWSSEETVPALFNKPAGIYFVTITDAHDCQLLTNIEIGTQGHIETTITQTNDNLCFKDEIASLLASSANGMSPITFIWSTGSTEQEIFNLGANEYFVTINDSWGCNGRDSIIVTEPPVIDLNIFTDNIKCKGDLTGSASITISGGTEPYSPLWQNGDITFFTNSLAAGQIWVTITDYNNCRDSIAAVITEPDSNVKINLNITNITCFRAQDGLINSFATGGTPPYFYYWNINGQTINDATIRELDFGTYNLTVVDNNNCLADTTVKLVEPDILKSSYIEGDPSCEGNFDGFINVVTSGGTQPYSYFMDEIQLESYFIDSLFQGEYYVQIIDSNNCTYSIGPIVLVDEEIDCLHIPAAFSPNGDGYNDEWFLENIQVFPKSMVQIYNRWGQLLYEERGIDGFWDGTYNGNPLPTGVYMYLIRLNNDSPDRTGTVTVVR